MNLKQDTTIDPDSIFLRKKDESTETESTTSIESLLYPELPKDYFKNRVEVFEKPKNGLQSIIERYENAKIKPYFSAVDFNNDDSNPYENKPKMGYEIGIKFSF